MVVHVTLADALFGRGVFKSARPTYAAVPRGARLHAMSSTIWKATNDGTTSRLGAQCTFAVCSTREGCSTEIRPPVNSRRNTLSRPQAPALLSWHLPLTLVALIDLPRSLTIPGR